MTRLLTSVAALAALGTLLGAGASAHAADLLVSYDDVGLGNLSGYNPFGVIDNQSAGLNVTLTQAEAGLVTTDTVTETLNGLAFTLTQHGSQIGTGAAYVAGFTFNLGIASFMEFVPSVPGVSWTWTTGVPTLSGGVITPGAQVGNTDQSFFDSLAPGKYTLVLSGVVDPPVGWTESFGGSISAVP